MTNSLIITSNLFEDYINCPTKCFLRASHEEESEDSYAKWFKRQNVSYQYNEITRLASRFEQKDVKICVTTKKGLNEYLTLLSICSSCEYQEIDFFDFLLSGEKDVAVYAKSKRKGRKKYNIF